ncbi:FxSxx-COOH system tetratricopeptide repeat protein [Kitasatospora sp. NPDC048365]|uniref:FxSxx-COOH system tetratricopeptide repeat protein n=1 Tax=Kitasatospora sp. NPDC048365 TaxID=3364050 RepID=UPI0037239029
MLVRCVRRPAGWSQVAGRTLAGPSDHGRNTDEPPYVRPAEAHPRHRLELTGRRPALHPSPSVRRRRGTTTPHGPVRGRPVRCFVFLPQSPVSRQVRTLGSDPGPEGASGPGGGVVDRSGRLVVSYAGVDRMWAEWAGWQLEHAGYPVELVVCEWSTGAGFLRRMEEALERAEAVVALLSPAYLDRPRWRTEEWESLVLPGGALLPLAVQPVTDVPALFAGRPRRALYDTGEADALAVLLDAVRGPARPTAAPAFPGVEPAAAPDREHPGADPDPPSAVINLPLRNRAFTGREGTLDEIRTRLLHSRREAVVLHGTGGVGKTQLALEYAHRFAGQYDVVWWVSADPASLITRQYAELAHYLDLSPPGAGIDRNARALLEDLRFRRRWLVVLDNAQDLPSLARWIPEGPGHVLITSPTPEWRDRAHPVAVGSFSRAESVAFLRARTDGLTRTDAEAVAALTADLPLALELAATRMASAGMATGHYAGLLEDFAGSSLLRPGSPRADDALTVGLDQALDQLEDVPALAGLLRCCAQLGPAPVPFAWLRESHGGLSFTIRPEAVDELLAGVSESSLFRREADAFTFHQLLLVAIRERTGPDGTAAARADAAALLAGARPGPPDDPASWPAWAELAVHLTVPRVSALADRHPELRRTLLACCRYLLRSTGAGPARALAGSLRQAWHEVLGPEHPDVLAVERLLTETVVDLGALTAYVERHYAPTARELLRRAADGGRRVGPADLARVPAPADDLARAEWTVETADRHLSTAAVAAELGRDPDARRHRFLGQLALALVMRGRSAESSRDLCLGALESLDPGDRSVQDIRLAVLVHLGADPAQYDDAGFARCLRRAGQEAGSAFPELLLPLLAAGDTVAGPVLAALREDPGLAESAAARWGTGGPDGLRPVGVAAAVERWRTERRRFAHRLDVLTRLRLEDDTLRDAEDELAHSRPTASPVLELDELAVAVGALRASLRVWGFEPQDRALRSAARSAALVRAGVRAAPTALAVELVVPAAERIELLVREARRTLERRHPPRPAVASALPAARYRPGTVTLPVEVGNAEGSAPVESAWLSVRPLSPLLVARSTRVELPAPVPGGGSRPVLVHLDLRGSPPGAVDAEVTLHHRQRQSEEEAVLSTRLTVPVDVDFEPVDNPFHSGALGRPVDDPRMFFGRAELTGRVRAALRSASSPGVGVAIFGQKRTGKSSIRLQLIRELEERDGLPVVDVGNLGELAPQRAEGTDRRLIGALLWRILSGADRTAGSGPRLLPPGFDRQTLLAGPDPVLDCARLFERYRESHPGRPPWVVFIDEFQYLDQWIRDGLVSASLMQAFKALVERRIFHLVLVGQSDLERLVQADPNAFGVFATERVSYLADRDARSLVQEPVLRHTPVGQVSRFHGGAVDEILRLSGGNPFYIQRFCSALVDHMNHERAAAVTVADVEQVADRFLDDLKGNDFDNLESPWAADSGTTHGAVRAAALAVARASSHGGAARRREVERCHDGELPEGLLDELAARQVLRSTPDGYRIVVGLYEAWLRRNFGTPERSS